jgi:hypothetical protein
VADDGVSADAPESPVMSALVTEHFALQSASSATISESGSRAALYLSALSSGLVAIGFASASRKSLAALAFSVLPTVYILGWFTAIRLVETSIQNIVCGRRIERIRRFYASLDPRYRDLFAADYDASGVHGVRYAGRSVLFTMASMVLLVNAVLGGATATLIGILGGHLPAVAATVIGLAVGAGTLTLGLAHQYRRLAPLIRGGGGPGGQELT